MHIQQACLVILQSISLNRYHRVMKCNASMIIINSLLFERETKCSQSHLNRSHEHNEHLDLRHHLAFDVATSCCQAGGTMVITMSIMQSLVKLTSTPHSPRF